MPKVKIIGPEAKIVAKTMDLIAGSHFSPIQNEDIADLLILTPNATPPFPNCNILLMPDELITIPSAQIAVSYGMSPKCTVTFSSVGDSSILAIQRELPVINGKPLEPQEILVKNTHSLSQYALMACSAALLILGTPPESLS